MYLHRIHRNIVLRKEEVEPHTAPEKDKEVFLGGMVISKNQYPKALNRL